LQLGLVGAVCVSIGAAYAQEAGTAVFTPDFFNQYAPRTALDMVERVPGFSIDEGEDRRGFTGAQGNVLIDGEAPASKAQEIEAILARIPASDVERIELVRGASAGSAQALRVNVVRRASGRGTGIWSLDLARAEDGEVTPSGEAAYSGRWGEMEYGLSAAYTGEHVPFRGEEHARDEFGSLEARRTELVPEDKGVAQLAGEANFGVLGWRAGLNAQLLEARVDETLHARGFDAGGVLDEIEIGATEERERIGELGASLQRDDGPWRTELTAVLTRARYAADETSAAYDALAMLDEAAWQRQRVERGESILHASLRRALGENWSLTFGAEAALNTLEQRLNLVEDDGSGPVPVDLPSANVRVEEERAELSFMLAGAPARGWSLEAGAAVEASRLTQTGDVEAEAELEYWKPSIQLARRFGDDELRLRLYRDVGQLDFRDFVSVADLENAIVDAGNPDLRPETSWRLEAAGDFRFGENRALSITLYRWAIEDALDVVAVGPPGNLFDAPGNIGDAELWGARVQLTWPLIWGAALRIDAMAQEMEADDPLTGEQRALSDRDESKVLIELRQDFSAFAWGVDYERERETPSYRIDRIELEEDAEELELWVETSAFGPMKWRLWAENVSDDSELRRRRFFDPDRLGLFDGDDTRTRRAGVTIGVTASGRF
jgi:outer membrane receptor for ferrienterochelin and colicin